MVSQNLSIKDNNISEETTEPQLRTPVTTGEKNTLLFKNSFGEIHEEYIKTRTNQKTIYLKDVAFLQLHYRFEKIINYLSFSLGTLSLICGYLLPVSEQLFSITCQFSAFCMFVSTFYERKKYFVQVVFYFSDPIIIRIHKKQEKTAVEFIKKLSRHRYDRKI